MSSDQGKRLQKMIDTLMLSYNENQDIEHIGDMNIPAKESIKFNRRHSGLAFSGSDSPGVL